MAGGTYPYKKSENHPSTYLFSSVGPKGTIIKAVKITKLNLSNFTNWYDLAFGDWDDERSEIDDETRSNNGDLKKILNTVLEISIEFLTEHPICTLVFRGSMDAKSLQLGRNQRNNTYGWMISKNLEMLNKEHKIAGVRDGAITEYEPDSEYDGFLVKRK